MKGSENAILPHPRSGQYGRGQNQILIISPGKMKSRAIVEVLVLACAVAAVAAGAPRSQWAAGTSRPATAAPR